jgi:hypothetical protein
MIGQKKIKNICVRCWSETPDQNHWVKDDEGDIFCSLAYISSYTMFLLKEINEAGE